MDKDSTPIRFAGSFISTKAHHIADVSSLKGFEFVAANFLPVYCPDGTNDIEPHTKTSPVKDATLVAK